MEVNFLEGIKKAREISKKRNFTQSFEIIIVLKGVDTKQFALNENVVLPNGRGKDVKVCVVASGDIALKAKKCADRVIDKNELERISKKEAKKIAKEFDFFAVEAPLMASFAKVFGPVLGPRGKMPTPRDIIPPTGDPCAVVERLRKSTRVRARKSASIQAAFGSEKQKDEELAENAKAVLEAVLNKLEQGWNNIKKIFVKLSMGPVVKVYG